MDDGSTRAWQICGDAHPRVEPAPTVVEIEQTLGPHTPALLRDAHARDPEAPLFQPADLLRIARKALTNGASRQRPRWPTSELRCIRHRRVRRAEEPGVGERWGGGGGKGGGRGLRRHASEQRLACRRRRETLRRSPEAALESRELRRYFNPSLLPAASSATDSCRRRSRVSGRAWLCRIHTTQCARATTSSIDPSPARRVLGIITIMTAIRHASLVALVVGCSVFAQVDERGRRDVTEAAPLADHHQHLFSPELAALISRRRPSPRRSQAPPTT